MMLYPAGKTCFSDPHMFLHLCEPHPNSANILIVCSFVTRTKRNGESHIYLQSVTVIYQKDRNTFQFGPLYAK